MSILDKILIETRKTIEADRSAVSQDDLQQVIADLPPCLDFHKALAAGDAVRLIAEVKRASPSAGLIRADFDPVDIAKRYQEGGAACISVLTDKPFFQGSLEFLKQIRTVVDLPLLRKDFIVDEYQLLQARAAGADCVLLIAECLSAEQLKNLHDQAIDCGMQTLVELYEPKNLKMVIDSGTKIIGINNRNLHTFETSIDHTIKLCKEIPSDRLVIGESGIHTNQDVLRLKDAGVKAVLVGESLMRQENIVAATQTLIGKR